MDEKSCIEKLSVVPRLRNPQQVIGNFNRAKSPGQIVYKQGFGGFPKACYS